MSDEKKDVTSTDEIKEVSSGEVTTSTREIKDETSTGEIKETTKDTEVKKKTSHSGMRKTRVGKVLSNKMDKTIIVIEEKRIIHPIYKKYFKKTTKFAANDPKNTCDIGDTVKIMETRPLSKTKRWRLVEIVEKVK